MAQWLPRLLIGLGGALAALFTVKKLSDKSKSGPAPSSDAGDLDDWAPQETTKAGQCDPVERPGVIAFRSWFRDKYGEHPGAPRNIVADCDVARSTDSPSEHWEGRAWDWMITDDATARRAIDDLLANDGEMVRRAGIMYMIYAGKMWRSYSHGNETRVWAPYAGPNKHFDHIHFSFSWAGARGETSFYKKMGIA